MKNQLKWGSVLSYFQMGANVLINLLFTPIMISFLGDSEYGLYNTVTSTIAMLSMLNLGFNSSYVKYFAKYKSENDEERLKKLNGLFLIIFFILGAIAFLCGLFLTFNLDLVFKDGLTAGEYRIARVLMLLLTFNLAFTFPSSVFKSIISAHERYIFLKVVNMIRTLCGPLVSIPLLLMGFRSIAMVSALVVFYLVADFLHIYYALKKLKVKFAFGKLEKGLFTGLLFYTVFIAINMIVDQVNWNIAKIILGRYKGAAAVGVYSVGYIISTSYNMFSTSITGVFTPRIHKIVSTSKSVSDVKNNFTDLFIKVGRIQFLILGLISSGFIFYGKQFIIDFWVKKAGYEDAYYVALLLILPVTIPLIQNLGIEMQRALNKHRFRSIVYLFMAGINLIISIFMCKKYGVVGSATGTAFALIVANGLIMNIYYHKKCNINVIKFWKSILRMMVGLILPVAFGFVSLKIFNTHSLMGFVLAILCYTVIYIGSMWFTVMNEYEKNLVITPIKKICRIK